MAQYVAILVLLAIIVGVVDASFCDNITHEYAPSPRYVTQYGEPRNISVYWDSEIARAAAAQLTVILRYALGYMYVHLQDTPLENSMATNVICYGKEPFQEIKLMVSLGLEDKNHGDEPPVAETLFAHIAKNFRAKQQCTDIDTDPVEFYNDIFEFLDCGFEMNTSGAVYIYYLNTNGPPVLKENPLEEFSIGYELKAVNRTNLFQMLKKGNQSFLFFDYNIWIEDNDVMHYEKNVIIETSMSVNCAEKDYASQLYKISKKFSPSLPSLRPILELESSGQSIEEANCECIYTQRKIIDTIIKNYKSDVKYFQLTVISCQEDDDESKLITSLGSFIEDHYFKLILPLYPDNCTNPYYVRNILNSMSQYITPLNIGLVIGGVKSVHEYEVTKTLDSFPLPVFLFDTIDIDVDSTKSVWLTNGRMIHIVLAIQHFIGNIDINQVTVLSDNTPTADYFNDNLSRVYGSISSFFRLDLPTDLTPKGVKNILHKLINSNTSIVIVNVNFDKVVALVSAAANLDMNVDKEFTWILRDWKQSNITINLTYVTFSLWPLNAISISLLNNSSDVKQKLETTRPDHIWTPHTIALVDAVLTVVKGFKDVFSKYPQARDDPRSKRVTQQFERSLTEISPVQGVFQNHTYKGHSPEEVVVFVDKWQGSQQKLLAWYRVNATARLVHLEKKIEFHSNMMGSNSTGSSLHTSRISLRVALLFSVASRYYVKL